MHLDCLSLVAYWIDIYLPWHQQQKEESARDSITLTPSQCRLENHLQTQHKTAPHFCVLRVFSKSSPLASHPPLQLEASSVQVQNQQQ